MFEVFIRRPVLSIVLSLLIVLLGAASVARLQVRQYPKTLNTVIRVTTTLPGADSDLIQGFVTDPIEKAIGTTDGIDYITSRSSPSQSQVSVYVNLNEDPNAALTVVTAKVNETRTVLPRGIEDPVIVKSTGDPFAPFYIAFSSSVMSVEQMTDYLVRVIVPKLSLVPGVAAPEIWGGRNFAMRIWLDPQKMASYNLSAAEVRAAIEATNYLTEAGSSKGVFDVIGTTARTDLRSETEFRNLVIRHVGAEAVRLGDVAEIGLGPEGVDSAVFTNGEPAVYVGIRARPEANLLSVIDEIRNSTLPKLQKELPEGMKLLVDYDTTTFIHASIREVTKAVGESIVIVMVVIFLFMGSVRSVLIPMLTIPLSIIGVPLFLVLFGFSINLLTLLALVLAIGLVVDDAIVVVENVHRHIEDGLNPIAAAIRSVREIAKPVVGMTVTLAAVYTPVAFTSGLTGALFREFALTLSGSVLISGVIALTLSPMMCSRVLVADHDRQGLTGRIDALFARIQGVYRRLLDASLHDRAPTVVFAVIVCGSLYFLFQAIPNELAPTEDQAAVLVSYHGPASANLDYMERTARGFIPALKKTPEVASSFWINGAGNQNEGFAVASLKPWDERTRAQDEIIPEVQANLDQMPGITASAFPDASLPGSDGSSVQFIVTTSGDFASLNEVAQRIVTKAQSSGLFGYADIDLRFEKPQTIIEIDRDKAAAFGVTMETIGDTLALMTGGDYVNRMNLFSRSYKVIPQVPRSFRLDPDEINSFYVKTSSGSLIPLSSLVSSHSEVQPTSLNQFNQQNSATISGVPASSVTLGTALAFLSKTADEVMPAGFSYDYAGTSRQYIREGSALGRTIIFALAIIFLMLAAQFDSLRDPLVVLVSVPLSVCGALIPLALGATTLNIYSQFGLLTLIGLIAKHGILICEVARERQVSRGETRREAVLVAASLRLRPILMTTAAMVAGLAPLLFSSGAGAASRFSIAIVIVSGMTVGTLFTLFVLPVIYSFLATERTSHPVHSDAIV